MTPTICTALGYEFNPFRPEPDRIAITDIAHALAATNRFGGHTSVPYSVAQHSWDVSLRCSPAEAAYGLLHDAAEAYLGDIPTPIKQHLCFTVPGAGGGPATFKQVEQVLLAAIFRRFGLDPDKACDLPLSVRRADHAAYEQERASLMPECDWWASRVAPRDLNPRPAAEAKALFLNRYAALVKLGQLKG